jgi:hypothetical protein
VKIRAFTHVHTVASRDSTLTHEQIRDAALEYGVGAVFLTEHREALDDRGIAVATERCRALSDHRVVLVPGLEVASVERWHILGFGVTEGFPKGLAGEEVAARIRDAGGFPVLAHPVRYGTGWEHRVGEIGAIEVWNRHYDGRLSGDPGALRAYRDGDLAGTFGLDAHGPTAFAGRLPEIQIDARVPTEEELIAAVREGRFTTGIAGRPFDPRRQGRARAVFGAAYRGARRTAARLARTLPIPRRLRRRLGQRW